VLGDGGGVAADGAGLGNGGGVATDGGAAVLAGGGVGSGAAGWVEAGRAGASGLGGGGAACGEGVAEASNARKRSAEPSTDEAMVRILRIIRGHRANYNRRRY
jgi:hypothetical protein